MPSQLIRERSTNYADYLMIARAGSVSPLRWLRACWPIVFLVPLSWWADRGCGYAGIDPVYHTTVWIDERLGWFILVLAAISVANVLLKLLFAHRQLKRLLGLAVDPPNRVHDAFASAASELRCAAPRIAYLDVGEPIAANVAGPVILISRGMTEKASDADLLLVARHELVHATHGDAAAGIAWHLAFASLLLPGFEPLERKLHAARERRANLIAAEHRESEYLAAVQHFGSAGALCIGGRIGLEAAAQRRDDRILMWVSPALLLLLAVSLPMSHIRFEHDLPFLLTHHC